MRPAWLYYLAPWQEFCHDGLDVDHRRAVDGIEPGNVKLSALYSQEPTSCTSKPIRPVLRALRKDAGERPFTVAARMPCSRHDGGRVDTVEAIENFDMGEFTQTKESVGTEPLSQPNRRRFEVPAVVYGLCSRARNVADWIYSELQDAPP
jgi:hypothetical protein